MLALRGVYDGKTIRLLPDELAPEVRGETPVAVIFLEGSAPATTSASNMQASMLPEMAAQQLDQLRDKVGPIGASVRDLIDEGRYR